MYNGDGAVTLIVLCRLAISGATYAVTRPAMGFSAADLVFVAWYSIIGPPC